MEKILFTLILPSLLIQQSSGRQWSSSRDCASETPSVNKEHETAVRDQHNFYRAKHQSPPLVLNDQLSLSAQKCADYYVNKSLIDSSCESKNGTGQNQYATWYKPTSTPPSCSSMGNSATTSWYNAVQYYDFRQPGYSPKTGSFTQLVWKNTKYLGVGCATKNGFAVIVSLYSPAGNKLTHGSDPNILFKQNVLPPVTRNPGFIRAVQQSSFAYVEDH